MNSSHVNQVVTPDSKIGKIRITNRRLIGSQGQRRRSACRHIRTDGATIKVTLVRVSSATSKVPRVSTVTKRKKETMPMPKAHRKPTPTDRIGPNDSRNAVIDSATAASMAKRPWRLARTNVR